jgi:hypothetical protein
MKRAVLNTTVILLILFSTLSCTKVVNINLNNSAPKIIIEGSISDQPSSCSVKLSMTVNYDEPNVFPAVTGSLVTISDNLGNTAKLNETSRGFYSAPSFKGVPGRTYTLSVVANGKTYTAVSKMPDPIMIDTIYQDSFNRGNYGGGGILKFVVIQYKDPRGIDNYYRFVEKINKTETNAIYLDNDMLRDGNIIAQNIIRSDPSLKTGDSVRIFLMTIDKNVFNYFAQLNQITNNYGPTATPANPISNFSNGALGYFSAYSVRSMSIVIK